MGGCLASLGNPPPFFFSVVVVTDGQVRAYFESLFEADVVHRGALPLTPHPTVSGLTTPTFGVACSICLLPAKDYDKVWAPCLFVLV